MPKISVIILNWNGARLLREFLPQVIKNTDPSLAEVVVSDNGSDDDSLQVMRQEFPGVKLVQFDKNYGFAEGYNRAIKLVGAEYSILLNSDVAPAPGWVQPLASYMAEHPRVAAAMPKIRSYKEPEKFEYAGACGGFIDKNGYPYCRGRVFDTCEVDEGQYDAPIEVFWATGAALMVRTEAYLSAGGLDPRFFAHMEEIDLCWRLRLAGWKVAVVPSSVVYHLGGGSLPASNPRKTYLNFRNNLLMMHKNLPARSLTRRLLVRRLLDTVAWAKFIATFDFANAKAVWRAHRDFAKMRKQYPDHPEIDIFESDPATRHNVLVQYYLRGRKKFDQFH